MSALPLRLAAPDSPTASGLPSVQTSSLGHEGIRQEGGVVTTDQGYACIVCGTTYISALLDDCRHCGAELAIFKCEEAS